MTNKIEIVVENFKEIAEVSREGAFWILRIFPKWKEFSFTESNDKRAWKFILAQITKVINEYERTKSFRSTSASKV